MPAASPSEPRSLPSLAVSPQAAVFDSASLTLVEELYTQFKANPQAVDEAWRSYFLGWEGGSSAAAGAGAGSDPVAGLAEAWRTRGFLVAQTNPLQANPRTLPELDPTTYGLSRDAAAPWQARYGGAVGIELGAIADPAARRWLQDWWEQDAGTPDAATREALYAGLVEANAFEQFLHKKFVGAKRFSVEGVDAIIPLLRQLAAWHAAQPKAALVLGMAHRGRLNVLCNLLGKPLEELLAAFADTLTPAPGGPSSGDVKYHLGKTTTLTTPGGEVVAQLLYNPSHLEAVNPMVLGAARARQEAGEAALPILIHGDSAVAGQGVVAEGNNLMGLAAYTVGGTLHVVLNNQVGFTANPEDACGTGPDARCTDIFKALGVPIFHCNADDIEACWRALRCAYAFRQEFGRDAVVELVGYRRWGHNEGDDPSFTQPQLYDLIRAHPVPAAVYRPVARAAGVPEATLADAESASQAKLEAAFEIAKQGYVAPETKEPGDGGPEPVSAAAAGALKAVAAQWQAVPEGFEVNSKVQRVLEERVAMLQGEKPLNWGAAETAAYGALLHEGVSLRLTGQDVERGTFSHRHGVLTCAATGQSWNVLTGLGQRGASFTLANSALSENAVMGFEYGYSLQRPAGLTLWEAQFGDFANGAQVVIDQFLASAAAKWGQTSNLTLLLPHGYEGQGPEHSSARLERFLQLCAENNLRVAYPSTPAQIFHLLRRQGLHAHKVPLVVMTPKSLLRLPAAVSSLSDLLRGSWQPVLPETAPTNGRKVVLCSGKIYYDLLARREELGRRDVALIRLEQLYPWPEAELAAAFKPFRPKQVAWVQEEPRNMGAWAHVREHWNPDWGYLHYVGRPAAASPAVGTLSRHQAEQAALVEEVFE